MESEEKPDREGYLDFKLRVEEGDVMLHARAAQEWHDDPDNPRTTLARYFEVFAGENHLEDMYYGRGREDRIARNAENLLANIRNNALRQNTAKHVASRIENWWIGRFRESCNFLEVHEWDVRERAGRWQAAHPGATESQSWFEGKKEAIEAHLDYAYALENKAKRDVQKMVDAAFERDRLELVAESGVDDRPRQRPMNRRKDTGRER